MATSFLLSARTFVVLWFGKLHDLGDGRLVERRERVDGPLRIGREPVAVRAGLTGRRHALGGAAVGVDAVEVRCVALAGEAVK